MNTFKNRHALRKAKYGCCLWCKTGNSFSQFEWTDQKLFKEDGDATAICPKCSIDSVIPGHYRKRELSRKSRAYWGELAAPSKSKQK